MPDFRSQLTYLVDPGHGWLVVPLVEIAALGIEPQISACSFIQGQNAYLEEDVDAPLYLDARAAQGIPRPVLDEQYIERFERPSLAFQDPTLGTAFWERLRPGGV